MQKGTSKKTKKFSLYDNKRTTFFISMFLFGIGTMVILYPKTMLSVKEVFIISLLFLTVDILVLKLKTKIKEIQTFVGLTISVLLAQLAVLLWLNYIPLGSHVEKHKIEGAKPFDSGTLIQLENNAYGDYFSIRFAGSKSDFKRKDSVTYYFKDGLLGFKILEKIE